MVLGVSYLRVLAQRPTGCCSASTIYILSVYTLLKVASYYDLSVLSMSVMGFQKKFGWGEGWVGGVSSLEVYFGFLEFF